MGQRYEVRKGELLAGCEVKPELFEGVRERLKEFENVRYLRAASLHSLGIREADAAPRARATAAGAPAVRPDLGRPASGRGAGPRLRARPRPAARMSRGDARRSAP